MNTATTLSPGEKRHTHGTPVSRQIRGSSLLLVGRLLGLWVNLAVQVLTVRYLSKGDYGALAYALTIASLGSTLAVLGLDKAVTVFVPTYQEQRDYDKLFGTIIMMVCTILLIGMMLLLLVYGLHEVLAQYAVTDQQTISLLLILIPLATVQALDSLLIGIFAVFAAPRAIFFRKYLLSPMLQLAVVLLLIFMHSGVRFLALGYVVAGILGVTICTITMVRMFIKDGMFQHFKLKTIKVPAREVFSFTIPLLTTDLVFMLRSSLIVVLLEYFRGTTEVATFKAVIPLAMLNMVVYKNFTYLFTPLAARMFERGDGVEINHLYWQTALWIAVISFPIFAVTFSFARPLTLLLFGARYEQSALILALLSLGYYFNAALGFNGITLRVFRKVRYIVLVDLLVALASITVSLLLIPRYGAFGAAVGACGTLLIQNILYQVGLWKCTGINLCEWQWLRVYLTIALGAIGLLLIQIVSSPFYISLVLVALVSLLVLRLNNKSLNIVQTFPELLRIPMALRLIGEKAVNRI